ncbi:PGRP2 amidase, partial [Nothocercus nigrocapillus]|nr:PGRP2 amidase [Nothocercus nigrocapillus]
LLAPDGSTVAAAPLLAGLEVGLKRAAAGATATAVASPDPLYAVTLAEALATSYALARGNGSRATLGPHGCWDDVEEPQVFTLAGPSSPVPDALANGALDGVLLGARLATEPAPLGALLRGYYSYGASGERAPSSYRRGRFGDIAGTEKLEEEVAATLRLLRALPATQDLLEDVGDEEVAEVARQAARDFMDVYVECPAVVPRCMWGARPYRGTPSALRPPLASVYIHHTHQPGAPCRSFAACAGAMRAMQRFHQDTRGWDDIGYSFVVGSDGYLYEGRGWRWVGAHTRGYNSRGYGVGYVGDYTAGPPDAEALALVRDAFLPCAVRAGHLQPHYSLQGHRQVGSTQCPGDSLFREIKTWRGFQ